MRNNKNNFVKKAKQIHKNKYDYSNSIYKSVHSKIEILCPNHGTFWQVVYDHLAGHGCPKCVSHISKKEIEFLNHLKIPDTKENRQKHIKPYKVDGYSPETNTIYEFLGDYYHGNPEIYKAENYNQICHKTFGELYKETFDKFKKFKELGYKVKYIWEFDWKKWNKDKSTDLPIKSF